MQMKAFGGAGRWKKRRLKSDSRILVEKPGGIVFLFFKFHVFLFRLSRVLDPVFFFVSNTMHVL